MVVVLAFLFTRVGVVVIVFGGVAVRSVVMLVLGRVAVGPVVMLVLGHVLVRAVVVLVLGRVVVGPVMMRVIRFVRPRRGAASERDGQGGGQHHEREAKRGSRHGTGLLPKGIPGE